MFFSVLSLWLSQSLWPRPVWEMYNCSFNTLNSLIIINYGVCAYKKQSLTFLYCFFLGGVTTLWRDQAVRSIFCKNKRMPLPSLTQNKINTLIAVKLRYFCNLF